MASSNVSPHWWSPPAPSCSWPARSSPTTRPRASSPACAPARRLKESEMTAFVYTVRLLAAAGIASLVAAAALAQSSETPGATGEAEQPAPVAGTMEWPCEAPLRGEMSIGAMWQGPDPAAAEEEWRKTPAVVALVSEIAPRRVPQDDALANVRRFAAGYQGDERAKILT